MLADIGRKNILIPLDLKSGYWQIPLNKEDKEKTGLIFIEVCMSTMSGLLVWSITPGLFQELVSIVLHGLGDFARVYLDDIITFSALGGEHIRRI